VTLKSLEKRAKRGLTRGLSSVFGARTHAELPDLCDLESILLIRQQNQFGDMLLASPMFRALRERAPKARIDLVSGPFNHDAVRASRRFDSILLYDKLTFRRRPIEAKRFVAALREARYDLVVVSSTVSFSMTSAWLAVLSGARLRAGREGPLGEGREIAESLYHFLCPPADPVRHQSQQNLDLVAPLGVPGHDWRPEIFLAPEEIAEGRGALEATRKERGTLVLMHPGAGKLPNRWPARRFGEAASRLRSRGYEVLACAGPRELALLAAIDEGAGFPVPRLPPLPIRSLAGAIESSDLLLCNDTGVLHLGAAVGTAVLALFGPTDPSLWCPASPRVFYIWADSGELENLEVEPVVSGAVSILAELGRGEKEPNSGELPAFLRRAPVCPA
jgi:ADP-heptose:LPS heptosyltransferase